MTENIEPKSILSLVQKEFTDLPCFIDPILPKQGVLILGGEAKSGKSWVLLELARALCTGTSPFEWSALKVAEPVKVLLVEMEVGERGLQRRVQPVYQSENPVVYGPRMWYCSKIPELQLDTVEGKKILHAVVEKVQPNVLILDPLGRFHSGDENKADQMQAILQSLDKLLKLYAKNDMSLILSHHFAKSGVGPNARDPLSPDNFRGSTKFKDNPDTLVTMQRLGNLGLPWKSWEIKLRFETRQDEGPPDILVHINESNDRRVRFKREAQRKAAPPIENSLKQRSFKGVDDE